MRSGAATAQADIANHVAPSYFLARDDGEAGQVTIQRGYSVAMPKDRRAAIAIDEISVHDLAVGRCDYGLTIGSGDINTAVECAFTIERIGAFAECSRDSPHHRPYRWGSRGSDPVSQGESMGTV